MSTPNVISVTLMPRYKQVGRHLTPAVVEACKRVLYDNSVVTMETITAEAYHAATVATARGAIS